MATVDCVAAPPRATCDPPGGPAVPLLGLRPKEGSAVPKIIWTQALTTALLTTARKGPSVEGGYTDHGPPAHESIARLQKGRSPDTRYHMDDPRFSLTLATTWMAPRTRCSVREADTEGHTECDTTNGKCPEQADPQTQRVGSWLSGAGERIGDRGDRASFWGDGMSWTYTEMTITKKIPSATELHDM